MTKKKAEHKARPKSNREVRNALASLDGFQIGGVQTPFKKNGVIADMQLLHISAVCLFFSQLGAFPLLLDLAYDEVAEG